MNAKTNTHDIASIAKLIGDPARACMLQALLAGRALTAGELAQLADISPQTASSHLNKLVAGSLLVTHAQGRHRYYQLANRQVAHLLETLMHIAPITTSNNTSQPLTKIRYARSCYDHLAGKVGVAITHALLKNKFIKRNEQDYELTPAGKKFFTQCDINIEQLIQQRRRFAYPCLDWSERVHHLAGALGAAFLNYALEKRWFLRIKDSRALQITAEGKMQIKQLLKIEL